MASKKNQGAVNETFDNFDGEERELRTPFVKVVLNETITGKIVRFIEVEDQETGEVRKGIEFEALSPFSIYDKEDKDKKSEQGQVCKWAVPKMLSALLSVAEGSKFAVVPTGKTKVRKGQAWNYQLKVREAVSKK